MMQKFLNEKKKLIQILKRDVHSEEIINAFSRVPRENFMLEETKTLSYWNQAVMIGEEQTISQPTTIGMMLELLKIKKGQRVLEIGSGSGYVLALIAEMIGQENVVGTEIIGKLYEFGRENLDKSGYEKIELYHTNPLHANLKSKKFDRIMISCASNKVPTQLGAMMKENGLILIPIGDERLQSLVLYKKVGGKLIKIYKSREFFIFVPLKN